MTADEQKASIESKRQEAVAYLRKRGIYRADLNCRHSYEPRPRGPIEQPAVVTVYSTQSMSSNHSMRS